MRDGAEQLAGGSAGEQGDQGSAFEMAMRRERGRICGAAAWQQYDHANRQYSVAAPAGRRTLRARTPRPCGTARTPAVRI